MMIRALITGITGMVGSHLADYLLANTGWNIYGMTRWRSPLANLEQHFGRIEKGDRLFLLNGDLRDSSSLRHVVQTARPDFVFHLAAQSFPQTSFKSPIDTYETNIIGTCRLLETLWEYVPDATIHVCASSEVFGRVSKDEIPIHEDCRFHPASPYAISKCGTDLIGRFYAEAYGMNVQTTRLFSHSVSRWTPVILRDSCSGLIDIKYISELREAGKRGGYFSGRFLEDGTQLWDFTRHNLEVWNNGCWTKIKHLSCHPIRNNKMLEIATRSGSVDVTDNHSVIGMEGQELVAANLAKGDKLKVTELPISEETDLPEELAWLYGFFVSEGCLTHGKIRIDNKKKELLDRCRSALLKFLACDSYYTTGRHGVLRITVRKPERFVQYFIDCYAKDHNKRIPKIILNASHKAKLAFLRGYNAGDGRLNHPTLVSEFLDFKTKSPILAMGLFVLAEEVLRVRVRLTIEHRAQARYYGVRPLNQVVSGKGKHLLRDSNEIIKITELPYEGEVWDFETENHWFNAGIGGLIVHNTGPRRGDVFVESSFAKQIVMIERGLIEPVIRVGNLNSMRTWLDVRDVTRAYHLLLTKDPIIGAYYNIGGEYSCTVGDMLNALLGMTDVKPRIEQDPARMRPIDADLQIPNTLKFRKHTGWQPEIPFRQTVQDLLDYWRNNKIPVLYR